MMHALALLRAFIPSVTSILLIADLIARPRLRLLSGDRRLFLGLAAAAAVVLYPSALGLVPVDLYRIGFAPVAPLILATVAACLADRHPRFSCAVLVILIAFDLHLLGGTNLWDYVVDPFVGVIAIVWAAFHVSSAILEVRSSHRAVASARLMMVMCVLAAGANAAAADLSLREFNVYVSRGESPLTWHGHSVFRSAQFEWIARSPRVERRIVHTTVGASLSYHDIRQARSWFGYSYGDPDDSVRGYSSFFFVRHHWRDNARNVQPFVELGTGPMWSNRRVPAATSRFNMDSQLGIGAMLFRGSRVPMLVGYRLSHISNGGTARRNPGLAVHSLMLGVRLIDFRRGATP